MIPRALIILAALFPFCSLWADITTITLKDDVTVKSTNYISDKSKFYDDCILEIVGKNDSNDNYTSLSIKWSQPSNNAIHTLFIKSNNNKSVNVKNQRHRELVKSLGETEAFYYETVSPVGSDHRFTSDVICAFFKDHNLYLVIISQVYDEREFKVLFEDIATAIISLDELAEISNLLEEYLPKVTRDSF